MIPMSADTLPPAPPDGGILQPKHSVDHDLATSVFAASRSANSPLHPDDDAITMDEDSRSTISVDSYLVPSNETFDDLHVRFAKVLNSATSIGSHNVLEIPKDYSMQYDHPVGPHAVQLALCEQLLKNRQLTRRRGSVSTAAKILTNKRIKPGFDPVQLLKKRALHFAINSPTQTSTLTCQVHRIFRADNFHGVSDGVYQQLVPALKLASLMLTHRACSQYWHTLWFGRRQRCEDTSKRRQVPSFRITEDVPWSSEQARIFAHVLDQQAERLHFYFHGTPLEKRHAHASFFWVRDTRHFLPLHHSLDYETFMRGKICLHTDFYTVAERNSRLSHPDPAALLRYHFWLATSICHEIAHYLEWTRRSALKDHEEEVFYYEDDWNEAGEAWEKKMFGGRVEPIASRADCVYGLATVDWPLLPIQSNAGENIYWALPMEYVSEVQQQKTWDLLAAKDHPEADATNFHIPRIGTRSYHLSGVDMTVWEDGTDRNVISDDLDDMETRLKRTMNGRIVKRTRDKRRMGLMVKAKKKQSQKQQNNKQRGEPKIDPVPITTKKKRRSARLKQSLGRKRSKTVESVHDDHGSPSDMEE